MLLDLLGEPLDGILEILDVGEQLADQQGVVCAEAAFQCLAQLRELLAELALGELRERGRIPSAIENIGGATLMSRDAPACRSTTR